MNITKNWFYTNLDYENIVIEDNLVVAIFDVWDNIKTISLWENSSLEYFSFFWENKNYDKVFTLNKQSSTCHVKSLVYGKNNNLWVKIFWDIEASNSNMFIKILSFVWENSNIYVDWNLKIWSNINKVEANLKEENIYLWSTWRVVWIPTLFVESSDVIVGHSCSIEKISDEKLFYLRSRWIDKDSALKIMVESKIRSLYNCLEMYDQNFEKDVLLDIIEQIWE